MAGTIIPFDSNERILCRVNAYVAAVDELIRDGDQAIDTLLKGFPLADNNLKIKIVIMLGTLANDRVAWLLFDIMCDALQVESIRQAAAIQISVIGAVLQESDALADRLLEELKRSSPVARANAAFALGWEGNLRAAHALIDALSDPDIDVQQAAINALSNLRDERLFYLLAQRLKKGSKNQQRSILYNLGHFPSRQREVRQICITFVHHSDPDLRFDALVVLNSLADSDDNIPVYRRCLDDDDPRIRELALTRLVSVEPRKLKDLFGSVRRLVTDQSARVRQAATRLIHHMQPISLA